MFALLKSFFHMEFFAECGRLPRSGCDGRMKPGSEGGTQIALGFLRERQRGFHFLGHLLRPNRRADHVLVRLAKVVGGLPVVAGSLLVALALTVYHHAV